jgi:membrane-associated phospholipid phosphatase
MTAARSEVTARPARRAGLRAVAKTPWRGPAWRRAAWLAGGLAAGWAALATWVHSHAPGVPAVDTTVHRWALEHRDTTTIHVARVASWFGQTDIALPLIVVAGLAAAGSTRRFGRLRAALLLLGLGGVGVIVGLQLNRLVGRARPLPGDWAGAAGGFSFPSGHTTAATLAAGLVAWSVSRRLEHRNVQIAVWAGAALWAGAVGWSRVWLGVHWPTDVVCGWLFAGSFLVLARTVQLKRWPADAPPTPVVKPEAAGT